MVSNPSHLEAVDPVVEGVARAKQDRDPRAVGRHASRRARSPRTPCSRSSSTATPPSPARAWSPRRSTSRGSRATAPAARCTSSSTTRSGSRRRRRRRAPRSTPTDVAKMVQSPIFHVNGDDPEACARAMRLAFEFREAFSKDVVVDLVCYRRHGHNEGDDPSYTQPLMYKVIDAKRSVRKLYTEALVRRGDLTLEEAEQSLDDFNSKLQAVLDEVRERPVPVLQCRPEGGGPRGPAVAGDRGRRPSGCARSPLATTTVPEGFTVHPKLARLFGARDELLAARRGRLVARRGPGPRLAAPRGDRRPPRRPGHPAGHLLAAPRRARRLRDGRRSTCPLCHLEGATGRFTVRDSLLSEYAALGFEYGYSVERPETLVAWEAQFGDFVNGAEIIIDNFLVAAEDKWGQQASLDAPPPPRLRGAGPRALERAHRALPLAVCAQQPARRGAHVGGRSTSTCCAARSAAPRPTPLVVLHAEVAAPCRRDALDDRRARDRAVPRGPRRPREPATPRTSRSSCSAPARSLVEAAAHRAAAAGDVRARSARDRPRRAALPVARRRGRRGPRALSRARPTSAGSRRSRRTWGRGRSSTTSCTATSAAHAAPRGAGGVGQPGDGLGPRPPGRAG